MAGEQAARQWLGRFARRRVVPGDLGDGVSSFLLAADHIGRTAGRVPETRSNDERADGFCVLKSVWKTSRRWAHAYRRPREGIVNDLASRPWRVLLQGDLWDDIEGLARSRMAFS